MRSSANVVQRAAPWATLLLPLAAACQAAAAPAPSTAPSPTPAVVTAVHGAPRTPPPVAAGNATRFTRADVDFMTGMIQHHAQALVMAKMAPTHGASPELLTLAARILNAQHDEIASMRQWLIARGQPAPDPEAAGSTMAGHDMHAMHGAHASHDAMMPGMLSDAELRQLDAARGAEFDRLFLSYMIRHHQGGVSMVRALFDAPAAVQDEAAFKIASDIHVDQITEIERMQRMLTARLFAGTPD